MSGQSAAFDCACCGPADRPISPLASLCDTCAAGSCAQCNGLASGAETPGSGYVHVSSSTCISCAGAGYFDERDPWGGWWARTCKTCSGLGATSDPSHGFTSMSPDWCHYLTLTSEDCRNV